MFCSLVLGTLDEALEKDPQRTCFRLIGGVLVERTVQDVVPTLRSNRDNVCHIIGLAVVVSNLPQIKRVVTTLAEQYKSKEDEFSTLVKDYNIRPVRA